MIYMPQYVFFCAGFIESAPSVKKIKVFEKYFTSKIHLYDKVSLSVCFCVFHFIKLIIRVIISHCSPSIYVLGGAGMTTLCPRLNNVSSVT